MVLAGNFSPNVAEANGFREVLSWVLALGINKVIFELDSKLVVDAVLANVLDMSEFGIIISNCVSLVNLAHGFSVQFVKRQANGVAHALARASCMHASPCTWQVPPVFVRALLSADETSFEQ
ncbi:hypothetical protein MRB53_032163 [Persea americana]|uniref:Uncharacterized protein n=1 Tax=Persea americana TaxID=3435 RepID=A0ACC2KR42_PERAE|nr:hypothetical protein MRB53_032163 [Persea americana]